MSWLREIREWADQHGYLQYNCARHGKFWSDSGDGCPRCGEDNEDTEEG